MRFRQVAAGFLLLLLIAVLGLYLRPKAGMEPAEQDSQEISHSTPQPPPQSQQERPSPVSPKTGRDKMPQAETTPVEAVVVQGRIINNHRLPLPGTRVFFKDDEADAVITDENGRYQLLRLTREQWVIHAEAEGHMEGIAYLGYKDQNPLRGPTIILREASCLASGMVADIHGKPISGAVITITPTAKRRLVVAETTSNARGRFQLPGLAAQIKYDINIHHPDFSRSREALPVMEDGEVQDDLLFALNRLCLVTGQAITPSKKPVAGARVRLYKNKVETDAQGRFSLRIHTGKKELSIRGQGFAYKRMLNIPHNQATLDLGQILLQPSINLKGRVLNVQGEGIPQAELFMSEARMVNPFFDLSKNKRSNEEPEAWTDDDGYFLISDLLPGTSMNLTARHPNYRPAIQSAIVVPREEPLTLTLREPLLLHGRVVDENGLPVDRAFVVYLQEVKFVLPGETRITGSDGLFQFSLGPGSYKLKSTADGKSYTEVEGLELKNDVPSEPVEIVLSPSATLEGQVTDPDGVPIPNVRLSIVKKEQDHDQFYRAEASTDGDGWYVMDNVQQGNRTIAVNHMDYHYLAKDIFAEKGLNQLNLIIEPKSEDYDLTGTVLDAGGAPLEGAYVRAKGERVSKSARTDNRGKFRLEKLMVGAYEIVVSHRAHLTLNLPTPVQIQDGPVENLTLQLETAGAVYGRLTGISPEFWPYVSITANGKNQWPLQGKPDPQAHTWRMDGVQPGVLQISAFIEGFNYRAFATVTMPDPVEELRQDLRFQVGLTLSGQVTKMGEPWPGLFIDMIHEEGGSGDGLTNEQGRFKIDGLREGKYRLSVRSPNHVQLHSRTVILTQDMELPMDITLAAVSVLVVDDNNGEPIPGAEVTWSNNKKRTGDDGLCFFPDIATGNYWVYVKAPGYQNQSAQIPVADGQPIEKIFNLAPSVGLSLEVTLSDNRHPEKVWVRYYRSPNQRELSQELNARQNGRVYLETIPEGQWNMVVYYHNNYHAEIGYLKNIAVPNTIIPVRLAQAGKLELYIADLDPKEKDVKLKVFDAAGFEYPNYSPWREGKFSILLPPGLWTFEIQANDGRSWTGQAMLKSGGKEELSL